MAKEKHFVIRWPELGISIECKPLPYNRATYDWYLDHLPLKGGRVDHVAVTGDSAGITFRLPEDLPLIPKGEVKTMLMTEAPVGFGNLRVAVKGATGLGVTHGRISRCEVKYGPTTEAMESSYCFQVVDEDIEKLKQAGEAIRNGFYKTKQIFTGELSEKK